jgi:hypothetical protein
MENETNMGAHSAYPTLRKEREGWGTRTLIVGREKRQSFDWGFAPSSSTHVRWCEHGAPVQSLYEWKGFVVGKRVRQDRVVERKEIADGNAP